MCQHFKRECDAEEAELSKNPGEKEKWEGAEGLAGPPYISPDAQSCGTFFKEAV